MSDKCIIDKIRYLFIHDDGSLPDIFLTNLDERDLRKVYLKAISLGLENDRILAWNIKADKQLEYTCADYLELFISNEVETSRIALPDLLINDVTVPISTIAVYNNEEVEFDYRMGEEWTDECILALLEFIALLKDETPKLKTHRAYGDFPTADYGVFKQAFDNYYQLTRIDKTNAPLQTHH